MKKTFVFLFASFFAASTAFAQVDRKEIDIEAYGEHVQVFNTGKDGLVFFYPLEAEDKKQKDIKYKLQNYDRDLTESWSQEFELGSEWELLKMSNDEQFLYLLFKKTKGRPEYTIMQIDLIDGAVVVREKSDYKELSSKVNDFDIVSTNLVLHAQEKKWPVSFAVDMYTGRTRVVGGEDAFSGKLVQRVGTGANKDLSGYWDFVNVHNGENYQLKVNEYDGAGQELNKIDVVLGPGEMLNDIEVQTGAQGSQYLLGQFGPSRGKSLKPKKSPFEISTRGNKGLVFGKIDPRGQLVYMNSIPYKEIRSFVDMARQIPSYEEQMNKLKENKKRFKSPGILNPFNEDGDLIHYTYFHPAYEVDAFTRIVVVEFYHPEFNFAEKVLPELPMPEPRREELLSMEAEDLVEQDTRGYRSSGILVMAFSNLDGSLMWDYAIKMDGAVMDAYRQRAKVVIEGDKVIIAYGSDNTVVTKTLMQGAVVDNAITSVPAPGDDDGRSRRKGKGTLTSGLAPWYDNLFVQYEYTQVKVKKSKSKKKKKRKTTYSFTVLPVYN